ncbi:type 1 glutamine amidotransferase [Tropicibacter sp. R16_0]|uniref:type 1 glutamine amidotransferase n=1 Tax=Tropicibacter sp. R16_0 TaxID=2821102 RepID=UPI001AD972CC|nr:type 1 glutamine amidotransferase [Tropicibacter sp. R16_0]MBO9450006.1 type 1 glutamine amidotransferase [Tropicibacter sp. R16_0]
MKIGILITGHAPDALIGKTGDYDKIFARLLSGHGHDFDFAAYAVVDNEFPNSAEDCDGWLLTGSKHGAYEDHDWIPPLEQLIRDIHARGLPMIGVCFGHQIIAQALGGKVEKFSGGWAIGPTEYDYGDRRMTMNAWHQDQVTELPDGATVLAGNDFCKNAVLAYGDTIWTVQPHPEFDNEFVDGLIKARGRGLVPDTILDAAESRLTDTIDSPQIAREMADFFAKAGAA